MKTQSLLTCCLVVWTLTWTASAAAVPTVEEIVRRVVDADENQQKKLSRMEYDQSIQIDRLDGKGKVTRSKLLQMVVRPGAENALTVTSHEQKGVVVPASANDIKQAHESEKNKTTFSLRRLVHRYDTTLAGEENLNLGPAWVLAFKPKAQMPPPQDRVDKVLNYLQGKMWVHRDHYTVLKTEAMLTQSIELAWFFATMESFSFHYTAQSLHAGYGPADFQLQFKVEAPFQTINQRQRMVMTNFRPRNELSANER